jgi:hypothetical protein
MIQPANRVTDPDTVDRDKRCSRKGPVRMAEIEGTDRKGIIMGQKGTWGQCVGSVGRNRSDTVSGTKNRKVMTRIHMVKESLVWRMFQGGTWKGKQRRSDLGTEVEVNCKPLLIVAEYVSVVDAVR